MHGQPPGGGVAGGSCVVGSGSGVGLVVSSTGG